MQTDNESIMSPLMEVHLTFWPFFVGAQCHKSGHLISHPELLYTTYLFYTITFLCILFKKKTALILRRRSVMHIGQNGHNAHVVQQEGGTKLGVSVLNIIISSTCLRCSSLAEDPVKLNEQKREAELIKVRKL